MRSGPDGQIYNITSQARFATDLHNAIELTALTSLPRRSGSLAQRLSTTALISANCKTRLRINPNISQRKTNQRTNCRRDAGHINMTLRDSLAPPPHLMQPSVVNLPLNHLYHFLRHEPSNLSQLLLSRLRFIGSVVLHRPESQLSSQGLNSIFARVEFLWRDGAVKSDSSELARGIPGPSVIRLGWGS